MAFSYCGLGHLQEDAYFYKQCDRWNNRTLSRPYWFWVPMKSIHFVMSCWMAPSSARWASSVFFRWDMKAVSCSFHWSVNAVMVFRYSASFRKHTVRKKNLPKNVTQKMIRTNEIIEKDTCGYLGWQVNAAVFSRSEPTLLTEMQLGEELQLLHADHLGNRSLVLSNCKTTTNAFPHQGWKRWCKQHHNATFDSSSFINTLNCCEPNRQAVLKGRWTHLEGEAESEIFPLVSLLSHLQQLSLQAAPLQLIQLVVTLDHTG